MKPGCYWIRRRLPRARWGGTEPKLRTPVPNWSMAWGRCWKYFSSYSRRELVLQQADRWGLTRMGFSLPAVELLMWQLVSWTWVSGPGARDVALVCDFTGQQSIKWCWKAAVPQLKWGRCFTAWSSVSLRMTCDEEENQRMSRWCFFFNSFFCYS